VLGLLLPAAPAGLVLLPSLTPKETCWQSCGLPFVSWTDIKELVPDMRRLVFLDEDDNPPEALQLPRAKSE